MCNTNDAWYSTKSLWNGQEEKKKDGAKVRKKKRKTERENASKNRFTLSVTHEFYR